VEIAMADTASHAPDTFQKLADDPDIEMRRKVAAACARMTGDLPDRIRQAALERLNHWHEYKPDMSKPASMMIVVTDGDQRQEFSGYPGIILNLSPQEREEYWRAFGRFRISSEEIIVTDYVEGGSQATVHTFTGHEAFSMTLNKLGNNWVVTKVQATFRVY
jgi:hypothetical protein